MAGIGGAWFVLVCFTLFWCDSLCFFQGQTSEFDTRQIRGPRQLKFWLAAPLVHVPFHHLSALLRGYL
jgi:hypothetical protein